jgi:hypothetical protein
MHQWVREFHVWWPQFRVAVLHESGSFNGEDRQYSLVFFVQNIVLKLAVILLISII